MSVMCSCTAFCEKSGPRHHVQLGEDLVPRGVVRIELDRHFERLDGGVELLETRTVDLTERVPQRHLDAVVPVRRHALEHLAVVALLRLEVLLAGADLVDRLERLQVLRGSSASVIFSGVAKY